MWLPRTNEWFDRNVDIVFGKTALNSNLDYIFASMVLASYGLCFKLYGFRIERFAWSMKDVNVCLFIALNLQFTRYKVDYAKCMQRHVHCK